MDPTDTPEPTAADAADGALLTDLMHREVDHLVVPTELIVAAATREGRARLRRRRGLQGLGVAAAAVALMAGVAVLRPDAAGQPVPDRVPVASDPAGPAAPPSSQAPQDGRPPQVVLPSGDVARLLADLLPGDGEASRLRTRSEDDGGDLGLVMSGPDGQARIGVPFAPSSGYRFGSLIWDDGEGEAAVDVVVEAPDPNAPGDTLDQVRGLCDRAACTDTEGGGYLAVLEAERGEGGLVTTLAYYLAPDGTSITVTALNAPLEKDAAPTRDLPPFTGAELAEVAMDPVWR